MSDSIKDCVVSQLRKVKLCRSISVGGAIGLCGRTNKDVCNFIMTFSIYARPSYL